MILTRATELQAIFGNLGKGSSCGSSTTLHEKLWPRLEGGGSDCPVVTSAITAALYMYDRPKVLEAARAWRTAIKQRKCRPAAFVVPWLAPLPNPPAPSADSSVRTASLWPRPPQPACSAGSYDPLAKHLAFYAGDVIDVGIEILRMRSMSGVGLDEAGGDKGRGMSTDVP